MMQSALTDLRFVLVGAKLSFVEPGRRWAHSPSRSKAPGISTRVLWKSPWGCYKAQEVNLLYGTSVCICLVRFTWLWASWGVPPSDSGLFARLLPPVSTSVPVHDSPLWVPQAPGPTSACGAAFAFSCFLWRFHRAPEGFFFLWTMTGSPVSCKELSSYGRVPTRGPSSESLQILTSGQSNLTKAEPNDPVHTVCGIH